MDLLIAEPLEAEVLQWLDARHDIFYAPRITEDLRVFVDALNQTRGVLLPAPIKVTMRTLARAPLLRAIGRIVGGPENIDLNACQNAGVAVVRALDATAPAEAEFLLNALLALLRPSPQDMSRVAGRELGHSTVGLIGMGLTARRLAQLLRTLGTHVIGYDPVLHATDPQWRRWGVEPVSLRELFEQSDAVSVQLQYFSRYAGLLGERVLPWCKQGQVIVSLSPSELFDETVLADVLRSGILTAVWLDNVGSASMEAGHPLHRVRGLLTTPRMASYTRQARLRSAWGVARQISQILNRAPATQRSKTAGQPAGAMPSGPLVVLRDRVTPVVSAASAAPAASTASH